MSSVVSFKAPAGMSSLTLVTGNTAGECNESENEPTLTGESAVTTVMKDLAGSGSACTEQSNPK